MKKFQSDFKTDWNVCFQQYWKDLYRFREASAMSQRWVRNLKLQKINSRKTFVNRNKNSF